MLLLSWLLFVLFPYNQGTDTDSNIGPDQGKAAVQSSSIQEIILIGEDRLIILDYSKTTASHKHIVWQLKTSELSGLPAAFHKYFRKLDDAKSVDKNRKLLISSSGGGIALIDRKTKKCLFYAKAPNAHSIAYLPGGRIAAALSTAKGGDRIELYDPRRSKRPLFTDSLYSGHGLSWNKERQLLYALGFDKLRAYALKNWSSRSPELVLEQEWKLPTTGGHDLFAPSADKLLLSTNRAVWEFDIDAARFSPFAPLAKERLVKSIYYNERTQEIVYTKGEVRWWTHQIHFLNPDKVIPIPELNLYKVRVITR